MPGKRRGSDLGSPSVSLIECSLSELPDHIGSTLRKHLRSTREVAEDAILGAAKAAKRERLEQSFASAIGIPRSRAVHRLALAMRQGESEGYTAFEALVPELHTSLTADAARSRNTFHDSESRAEEAAQVRREADRRRKHLFADMNRIPAQRISTRLRRLKIVRAFVLVSELVMIVGFSMGVAGIIGVPSIFVVPLLTWAYVLALTIGNGLVVFSLPWLLDLAIERLGLTRRLLPAMFVCLVVGTMVSFGLVVLNRLAGMVGTPSPTLAAASASATPALLLAATLVAGIIVTVLSRQIRALEAEEDVAFREESHIDVEFAEADDAYQAAVREVESHRQAMDAPSRRATELREDSLILQKLEEKEDAVAQLDVANALAVWDRVDELGPADQEEVERRLSTTSRAANWLGRLGRAGVFLLATRAATGCSAPVPSHIMIVNSFDTPEGVNWSAGSTVALPVNLVDRWADTSTAAYVPGSTIEVFMTGGSTERPLSVWSTVVPAEGWIGPERATAKAAWIDDNHRRLVSAVHAHQPSRPVLSQVDLFGAIDLARRAALAHPAEPSHLVVSTGGWVLGPGVNLTTTTPPVHMVLGRALARGIEWDFKPFASVTACGGGVPSPDPSRVPERDRFLVDLFARAGGPPVRFLDDCDVLIGESAPPIGETR